MNASEVLSEMENRGAVLRGHFRLSSGRHSDVFVQKFRVLENPGLTRSLGEAIADRFKGQFDVVASPAVGAIVLGFATALASDTRLIFAEREGSELAFRRGFALAPGERVLIVEDVITTGGSAREVVELVRSAGGDPAGVGALIDRCDATRASFGVPFHPLVELDVRSWSEDECPMCIDGHAIEDPGSRRLELG